MLPKEKHLSLNGLAFTENERMQSAVTSGYNQALSEVHALVPAIIEKVYEEVRGKIQEVIDDNDNGLWSGREFYDEVLVLLSTEK